MQTILREIRMQLKISQQDFAQLIGTSFASVNRWENGHSAPGKAVQLRLYDLCKKQNVDMKAVIQNRISSCTPAATNTSGKMILYHGSKSGITGAIAPISRARCDFGSGFYMGTDPFQPLSLISGYESSKLYVISLDLSKLNVLHVEPNLEWAMLVAYHRGKMEEFKTSKMYQYYAQMSDGADVIAGSIADDRMFYVLDNFFLGNITDQALINSLSALKLGQQYVAVTQKACKKVKIEAELELSHLERAFLVDINENNRVKGIRLADSICRDSRREGLFFDEILQKTMFE